jgi:hypothetical protein
VIFVITPYQVQQEGTEPGYQCHCGYGSGVASHMIDHHWHAHRGVTAKHVLDYLRNCAAEEQRTPGRVG